MPIRPLLVLAASSALLPFTAAMPAHADPAPCRPARVIVYAQTDWLRAAKELAANPSSCAQYFISVPPLAADKTQARANQAAQIRAFGANFHALDEINYTGWAAADAASGTSWLDAGVAARARMSAAGFDAGAGDSWILNELSSAVRRGTGSARRSALDFMRGLSSDGVRGVALTAGVSQVTPDLSLYKVNLQDWLQDDAFWSEAANYVSDWAQENYGDVRGYAASGVAPADRSASLGQYLDHQYALAVAGGGATANAASLLSQVGVPFGTAAWSWTSSYGFTASPVETMEDFVSGDVYAARALGAASGSAIDRIGVAWSPSNSQGLSSADFATQTKAVLDRIAGAIHDTDAPSDQPGSAACLPDWCSTSLDGAVLTNAWQGFSAWSPTLPVISAPISALTSQPAGPVTVELQTLGLADNAVTTRTVTLTSSSVTGSFASDAAGPWTPTLALTVPAGASSASFYYFDSIARSATLTATLDNGATATQLATVAAAPIASMVTAPVAPVIEPAPTVPTPRARVVSVAARVVGRHVIVVVHVRAGAAPASHARVRIRVHRGTRTIATPTRLTTSLGVATWRSSAPVRRGRYSATAGVLR